MRASSGRANTVPTIVTVSDSTRFMTTRLPITWSMVRWSFAPMARDSTEADPMPIIEAPPELMNVNG